VCVTLWERGQAWARGRAKGNLFEFGRLWRNRFWVWRGVCDGATCEGSEVVAPDGGTGGLVGAGQV